MAIGTIQTVQHDGVTVTVKCRVEEDDGLHDYKATVDFATFDALPNNAAKLAALVDAIEVVRNAKLAEVATITKINLWNDDEVELT